MRSDPAMLARLQLQSTSDQQNFLRYPPIAAAAPVAIPPEQCANWAYPQPTFSTDEIGFALCTALLGRLYLSGHLDQMQPAQLHLVTQAVHLYKRIRPLLAEAVPFWPTGLPGWDDPVLSLGLRTPGGLFLVVWNRGPEAAEVTLPVAHLVATADTAEVLFPPDADVGLRWNSGSAHLSVRLAAAPAACLISLAGTMSV
jgi:alpha-galactosidase